jgi:hypothetical protein
MAIIIQVRTTWVSSAIAVIAIVTWPNTTVTAW